MSRPRSRLVRAAAAAGLVLLAGCGQGSSSDDELRCTSGYRPVATAQSRAALKQRLLEDVDPRVRSIRVLDKAGRHGRTAVILLSRRHRTVLSLDMWRQPDGRWTAQQWEQCID